MAYNSRNLSLLAYANGFSLWHYTTPDDAATVGSVGYFNNAVDILRVGDMIMANTDTDGDHTASIFLVNDTTAGAVDVDNMISAGETGAREDRMQHTPGPWEQLNGNLIGATNEHRRTAIVAALDVPSGPQGSKPTTAERKANARLIVAAPDLLAALEGIINYEGEPDFTRWARLIDTARAAIAKARGRS